jgi:uncharacterized RDD family membrane protein YckC
VRSRVAVWLVVIGGCAPWSIAQDGAAGESRRARVAASASRLWVLRTARSGSNATTLLAVRGKFEPFQPPRPINGAIELAAARDDDLYAWFEDGAFYRFFADGSPAVREDSLPASARPVGWVAAERGIYAIVPSDVAVRLGQPKPGEQPTTEPAEPAFAPGESPLSVAVYGNNGWEPLIACPPQVTAETSPALCVVSKGLFLFWRAADGQGIRSALLGEDETAWADFPSVPMRAAAFWPLAIDGRILAVAGVEGGADGESIATYQYIGDEWQSTALSFSALPESASETRLYHRQVVAFKQHLCALTETPGRAMFLRFASFEGQPTEKTESLTEVFEKPAAGLPMPHQTVMLFALAALFAMVWIFRRGSMITPAVLPAGWRLAMVSRRAAAGLIDVLPFALVAAMWRGVELSSAIGQLFTWAIAGSAENPMETQPEVFTWWAITAGGYILYAALLELTAGRTVGKMILRLHLLNEAGRRPLVWQTLLRNALRIIEMVPQLWVMQFLVVLTRNRQRLGDIFARTLIVCADAPAKDDDDHAKSDDGGKGDDEADSQDDPDRTE